MQYPSKILINRTGKRVEFMCGGQIFIYEPGATKPNERPANLDGFVAYHALNEVNTGLEELTPEVEAEEAKREKVVMPPYGEMKFQKLVSRVGRHFKPGMTKEDCVNALEERWKKRNRKWLEGEVEETAK